MFFLKKTYEYIAVIGYFQDNVLVKTDVFSRSVKATRSDAGEEIRKDVHAVINLPGSREARILSISLL